MTDPYDKISHSSKRIEVEDLKQVLASHAWQLEEHKALHVLSSRLSALSKKYDNLKD